MIELVLAGAGVLVALAGVGFRLRRRDPDVAVLESSRRSRSDTE